VPCVKPDGTLTTLGRLGLTALTAHGNEEGAAQAMGLPLYRVRMLSRALCDEGFLEEREGRFAPTELGRGKLRLAAG